MPLDIHRLDRRGISDNSAKCLVITMSTLGRVNYRFVLNVIYAAGQMLQSPRFTAIS